jgi:hypothetical protein
MICVAMLRRIAKAAMIAALVVTIGAHWALLQTVAWTAMLADNLRQGSVCHALARTFDGNHPCCLCKAIAAGKKSDKKKDPRLQFKKLECPPAQFYAALTAPFRVELAPWTRVFPKSPARRPPSPPPRSLPV